MTTPFRAIRAKMRRDRQARIQERTTELLAEARLPLSEDLAVDPTAAKA